MDDSMLSSERFSAQDQELLQRHCTNTDSRCFALTNLPEVVKGALFARYSRSAKSLRTLLLNEFGDAIAAERPPEREDARAAALYERMLGAYGDDSVAQLGSAHVACEGVSNVMTKILERGRLMSYLEQSTRYVPYTAQVDGRWKYHTPAEVAGIDRTRYEAAMDRCFKTYSGWLPRARAYFERVRPRRPEEAEDAYRRAIRSKALDTLRGLLPASTKSNLGIHGSGQAFEALLLRLGAHELEEARQMGTAMLAELKHVIPAFVQRVERADRGGAWIEALRARRGIEHNAAATLPEVDDATPSVTLIDYDPQGERKVLAAMAYPASGRSLHELRIGSWKLTREQVSKTIARGGAERRNRRHRPPRALEHTDYVFEITGDYGAFRDLQRHRMLSIEWQPVSTSHGHVTPEAIVEMGADEDWRGAMDAAAEAHGRIEQTCGRTIAQYAVPMAYRIRFTMKLNAREAMHMIELRTQPAGHPSYRRVCQRMHELIRSEAGHEGIARLMRFTNHDDVELERMAAEQRTSGKNGGEPSEAAKG